VDGDFNGDAFFPEWDAEGWRLVSSEKHEKDEKNALDFTYLVYERKSA